ncbi:hypothetical protein [Secundilactobacillus oryzae]|uniref:hypothetical protein n=1 Tax=Secundilactobacillus oryzae TaxID=1202668 RepID=UPI0006D1EB62|nr:hypothetical protein [Secundilactobacillus oryzae]
MVNDNHVQTAEAATKKKQTVYLGKVKKARVIYRFDLKKRIRLKSMAPSTRGNTLLPHTIKA